MTRFTNWSAALACGLAMSVAACGTEPTASVSPGNQPQFNTTSGSGPTLLECPTSASQWVAATIGPDGGFLSAGGTSIRLPEGAVLSPTTFVLNVPASRYMEVDIHAVGTDSFHFELPVSVTLDYSRCSQGDLKDADLAAWYINSNTKTPIENMGGSDDKQAKKLTFFTGHLSGYAIAE